MVSPERGQGMGKAGIQSKARSLCMGGLVQERMTGVGCGRRKDILQEGRASNLMLGCSVQGTRLHLVQNHTFEAVHTSTVGTSARLN